MRWLCEALGVSRSGFHAWLSRPPSARAVADEALTPRVRASFTASDRTYGARRVWHDVLAGGASCGLHHVERLMREEALRARPRRRGLPADKGERSCAAIAANVLDRQFEASAPNQRWVADFTYVWTAEGWLYVAAVIDLFSRRVVGWSMNAAMTAQLVADALMMAIWRRGKPHALLHHSDQGSQLGSTGRRNGYLCQPQILVKRLGRCLPAKGLARPCVEGQRYCLESILAVSAQVGALWKVLTHQTVGILVRAPLPTDCVDRRSRRLGPCRSSAVRAATSPLPDPRSAIVGAVSVSR